MLPRSVLLLIVIVVSVGCRQQASPATPSAKPITVTFQIEFPDDKPTINQEVQTSEGATIAEAIKQIAGTQIEVSGSGAMAFVNGIDDVATGGGKGWIFYVNDQWATQGIGAMTLTDGDQVRWTYGSFEDSVGQ